MRVVVFILFFNYLFAQSVLNYTIVDTGQKDYFNDYGYIAKPLKGDSFFGQDASYLGNQASYTNNNDGTITDNITGLMWQKGVHKKLTYSEAQEYSKSSTLGGFTDWRIPTIKELYSLINFNGQTGKGNPQTKETPADAKPYIDTHYFDFEYPNERRYIDAQYWSNTDYVSTTMRGESAFFGVNFADGRIKGYPKYKAKYGDAKYYIRLVRGNKKYGKNNFSKNSNNTVIDKATNLIWMKEDSKSTMNWKAALSYCEELNLDGITTWRLPNAKELQSIVDYTKSPSTSNSAAINKMFNSTKILNEENRDDYGFYWTSTTHLDGINLGSHAVYISFGRALGFMSNRFGSKQLLDVHGAGAQRSDPKSGDQSKFSKGRGPQGDVVRINNFVRCISDDLTIINESSNYIIKDQDNKKEKSKIDKHIKQVLNRFDTNNDNKISKDEAPRRMKQNFRKHDLNNDGFIFEGELKTLLPPPR